MELPHFSSTPFEHLQVLCTIEYFTKNLLITKEIFGSNFYSEHWRMFEYVSIRLEVNNQKNSDYNSRNSTNLLRVFEWIKVANTEHKKEDNLGKCK